MIVRLLTVFLLGLLVLPAQAQKEVEYVKDNYLRYADHVYQSNIGAVTFHPNLAPIDLPIMDLGANNGALLLQFDDLDADAKDYSYTAIHCNADWTPSDLDELDYIDGFSSDEITEYEFSFGTLVHYTHYELSLPNDNMAFTKSGNYLLKVYDSDDENNVVLTRRFMVVERNMAISHEVKRAAMISKARTHQELDFIVNHKGINVRNPRTEVKVTVLQNGRWDNAISDLQPVFIKENQLIYDLQDDVVFPGGKEFRVADLSSTRYKAEGVKALEDDLDRSYILVMPDESRTGRLYEAFSDINGRYFIDNYHEDNPALESDYIRTTFTLVHPYPFPDGNIYLFGALSDWQTKQKFKMRYDEAKGAYQCTLDLKQGYYNYAYAFVKDGDAHADLSLVDGDWYDTSNDYTILVYYRSFGDRNDRLVGLKEINKIR